MLLDPRVKPEDDEKKRLRMIEEKRAGWTVRGGPKIDTNVYTNVKYWREISKGKWRKAVFSPK